jgi:hypothetical protein
MVCKSSYGNGNGLLQVKRFYSQQILILQLDFNASAGNRWGNIILFLSGRGVNG